MEIFILFIILKVMHFLINIRNSLLILQMILMLINIFYLLIIIYLIYTFIMVISYFFQYVYYQIVSYFLIVYLIMDRFHYFVLEIISTFKSMEYFL